MPARPLAQCWRVALSRRLRRIDTRSGGIVRRYKQDHPWGLIYVDARNVEITLMALMAIRRQAIGNENQYLTPGKDHNNLHQPFNSIASRFHR